MPFLSSDRQCQNTAVNSKHCPQLMVQPLPFFTHHWTPLAAILSAVQCQDVAFWECILVGWYLLVATSKGMWAVKRQLVCLIGRLIDWSTDWLMDWSIDWWSIDDRSFSGQIDWLIDWLIDGLIDRLMIDWWSIIQWTDWLIDDRSFSGQIDWLIEMFVLQAVDLMSSVPEWVDHLVELQLWVRLSQSALAAGDHASVSRCTDHALQFTCPDDQKQRSVASSTFLCWLQRNCLINY